MLGAATSGIPTETLLSGGHHGVGVDAALVATILAKIFIPSFKPTSLTTPPLFPIWQLFNLYCRIQQSPEELSKVQERLLTTPVAASFAKLNPTFEGCCMGNRKTCQCGAPFFS